MMDYNEKIQILRACSSKRGKRCSSCPAFGQGNHNCMRNAMKDAATALSELQDENNKLRAELEQVKREKESLLKYAADMGECCLCTYDSFCPTDNPMFGDCEECEKSRKCPCITCSETKNWQWRGAEKG